MRGAQVGRVRGRRENVTVTDIAEAAAVAEHVKPTRVSDRFVPRGAGACVGVVQEEPDLV